MTFLHGGDFGDLIYALPAMRGLGGGVLYLSEERSGRESLNPQRRAALIPLLEKLDYLEEIRVHKGERVDVDFTDFRKRVRPGKGNLAQVQLEHCGLPLHLADEPWIDRRLMRPAGHCFDLIIHRTERYRNSLFPWRGLVERFGQRAAFVGLTREYLDFVSRYGSVLFRPTSDLLELAGQIAGCRVFAGNQSAGYALAEAMKVTSVLEAYPGFLDCMFDRPNVRQVVHLPFDLDWMANQLA